MEKRIENARKKDREQEKKRLPTVAEKAAEDEEKSHRNAETRVRLKNASRNVAKSIANTEVANKKKLEEYEKKVEDSEKEKHETEVKIGDLEASLRELKNSLPSSMLQSAMSFLRGNPRASILREIDSINNKIDIEKETLQMLEKQLSLNQAYLDSLKKHYKPMKNPKL